MRVLAVGNMYPPHSLGGYELVWRSAMRHLRELGHEVRVLTSDYRKPNVEDADDEGVHRELRWYWHDHEFPRLGLAARLRLERHNAAVFERHLRDFEPEVVSWWAMGGMSLSLIERARRAGLPAVGFVHDDWLLYGPLVDPWTRATARLPGVARQAVAAATGIPAGFDPGRAARWLFVSEHTRRQALAEWPDLADTGVAHSGIDAGLFNAPDTPAPPWRWRLLYVGRIDPRKGIDTAIEALPLLPPESHLVVVGDGDPNALANLHRLARDRGVEDRIEFSQATRAELPTIYAYADAVVFPARWEEPWGLVPLEAMAVGAPVIATGTGGSAEYLVDGGNCLLIPPGDPAELAKAIADLAEDSELRRRLREGGFQTAPRHTEAGFNAAVAENLEAAAARRAGGRNAPEAALDLPA